MFPFFKKTKKEEAENPVPDSSHLPLANIIPVVCHQYKHIVNGSENAYVDVRLQPILTLLTLP